MSPRSEASSRTVEQRQDAKTLQFARFIVTVLEDKRAQDLVWLDVRGVTDLADYFLIATITNLRQGATILDECERERKRLGLTRIGIEGEQGSTWIVLDYAEIVVHLLMPEQREYYGLEHLWADAKRVE